MVIINNEKLDTSLIRQGRILGLDVGKKTVGIAISDVSFIIASPLEVIHRTNFNADSKRIIEIIEEFLIAGLIIGLPIQMDGKEGARCQSTRAFTNKLRKFINLPMMFWDERLSTKAVERMLIRDVDMTRKRRQKLIDKLAAAYILQGFLDSNTQK